MEMTPSDYEEYVSELIRQLDVLERGKVFRNKKYQGVRQPGEYEIDVSVEISFDSALDFLLIVECKKWKRPVDRPLVQKLAQTRDAIAAHKAAMASPVGFTREAVDVAQVHGIALWVISEASWVIVMGGVIPFWVGYRERRRYLEQIGFRLTDDSIGGTLALVDASSVQKRDDAEHTWVHFVHACPKGSAIPPGSGEPGIDPRTAASQVVDEVGRQLGMDIPHIPGLPRGW
ncbi:restriction endonuclease [Chloroflexota bacterium]